MSILFHIFLYTTQNGINQLPDPWNKIKDKDGIVLFQKDSSESSIKIYKGEMIISARLTDLENFIKHIENYPQWMTNVDSSRYISKISDTSFIYQIIMHVPVLKDIEAVASFELTRIPDKKYFETKSVCIPEYQKPNPKYKQLKFFITNWKFQELSDNKIKVTYFGMVDSFNEFIFFLISNTIENDLYDSFVGVKNHEKYK